MRATLIISKSTASSSRWLARQASDPFVKQRSSTAGGSNSQTNKSYRSRSSFKLLSLASRYPFLLSPGPSDAPHKIVVDLGAAPGGWSQVASQRIGERGKVFALDILDFQPIPGVHCITGDFLSQPVQHELQKTILRYRPPSFAFAGGYADHEAIAQQEASRGIADVVLSDMMAPMSGVRAKDIQSSLDLVTVASEFAGRVLRNGSKEETYLFNGRMRYPGGHFVVKFFQHPDLDEFKKEWLIPRFRKVIVEKPEASRKESSEAYWVCLGYTGEPGSKS